MWVYRQHTGFLFNDAGDMVAVGYSGAGEGKNNPAMQGIRSVGPIPRGLWVIGEAYNSKRIGPLALPLYEHLHNALERTFFLIHGDSISNPGNASLGCLIFSRKVREAIIASNDRLLKVIE